MSEIKLNVDEGQMRTIVAESIFSLLDVETRKGLIQKSIEKMLAPDRDGYGRARNQSPLEQSFERAVQTLMHEVVREYIDSHPEVRERIQEALGLALQKLSESDTGIKNAIAYAVSTALESKLTE